MKLFIWLLLQATLTFDPYSVRTIEYQQRDVKQLADGRVAYRQVMLTFDKLIIVPNGESPQEFASQQAPLMNPDADQGIFHYRPKDCKPMHDKKQRYVCVDKDWNRKSPVIYWTPAKRENK